MAQTPNNPLTDQPTSAAISGVTTPPQEKQNTTVSAYKPEPEEQEGAEDRDLLDLAHRRFRRVCEYEKKWREKASKELNFLAGEHWTEDMREERKGLPCLTFDKISPAINQVLNSNRQSPPEPRVSPVGDGADVEEAKILQGLLRNIAVDSDSDIAHETALDHSVKIGRGWERITFEYENGIDFKQKLKVGRISNPFSVYPDPSSDEFDYSDMMYCFKTEDLDMDGFEQDYPHAKSRTSDFEDLGDKLRNDWFPNGAVRVAEYWWIEKEVSYLCQLRDGSIVPWDDDRATDPRNVVNTRKVEKRKVRMAKLCGTEILERIDDYPGKWIPYIAIIGEEIIHDNKRSVRGMIRPAMDANLSYDYMRSKEAQAIGLAPTAQYLVASGAIAGHEAEWADSNRKPFNILSWNAFDDSGQQMPEPQRVQADAQISAIVQAIAHADNDVKTMTQEYDASLGKPVDQSGRAVIALQRQGDNAHFNYVDNLARSLRQEGRILLDLIPKIYSEERAITIYDPDGKVRQVWINQQKQDVAAGAQPQPDPLKVGADRIYNVKDAAARYDIVMGTGPTFNTRMQEASTVLPQIIQVAPIIMQAAPDLVLKILNLPYGDEIVERVRQFMGVKGDDSAMPPAAQAAIMKLEQTLQQYGAALKQATDENLRDDRKNASDERIALIRALAQVAAVEAKADTDKFIKLFTAHADARMVELQQNPLTANPPEPQPGTATAPQPTTPAAQPQGTPAAVAPPAAGLPPGGPAPPAPPQV